jgi:hypothetical protein
LGNQCSGLWPFWSIPLYSVQCSVLLVSDPVASQWVFLVVCTSSGTSCSSGSIFWSQRPSPCIAWTWGRPGPPRLIYPNVWACCPVGFQHDVVIDLEGGQLLGPLLQLVVHLGPPGYQRQLSPVSNLRPGISQVCLACQLCFGFDPGRKSLRSRPRSICAWDMPVSWSGVSLMVRRPFTSMTGSSSPLGLTASLITLLGSQ